MTFRKTVDKHGQVVLPENFLRYLAITPGTEVDVCLTNHHIAVTKSTGDTCVICGDYAELALDGAPVCGGCISAIQEGTDLLPIKHGEAVSRLPIMQ